VSVKLPGPFFFSFFFFDEFCFLCQLNCPDLCFLFFFFLMGFVFCDSYYSRGALCTRFILVKNDGLNLHTRVFLV
jgi:hypothetical protein